MAIVWSIALLIAHNLVHSLPAIAVPLLLMALGFKLYYITVMLMRARCEVLDRERRSGWVRELIGYGKRGD